MNFLLSNNSYNRVIINFCYTNIDMKLFLVTLFMWNFITERQTSGKRMVFHSGKWKFVGKKHNMTYDFLIHTFSDMTHSWPDQITPGSGKLLASGLPMSKTWRLRFEVLFKTDDRVTHRTIFHGTDGKGFSHTRCGGRLPGIWTKASAYPDLRHDFC